jgi:hypothetical protein
MSSTQKYIIIKDRVEIYKDFTINLLNCIYEFYLGPNDMCEDTDIHNYFRWCFNRVCDEFKKEGLDFSVNEPLRAYFFDFFYHQYFKRENQNIPLEYYEKFWRNIFDISPNKNKNVMNTMIELYNIFDTSINQEKNILEIV